MTETAPRPTNRLQQGSETRIVRRPTKVLAAFVLALVAVGAGVWGTSLDATAPEDNSAPAVVFTAPSVSEVRLTESDRRLAEVEQATARLEAAIARTESMSREALAASAGREERFILAMLHLQAAVTASRPWVREYQAAVSVAPAGALSVALDEVLVSHAARGLPTEADLRERFAALAPAILVRTPTGASVIDRAVTTVRSTFSAIGMARPPAPSDAEATVQRIQDHLRRGKLAAAVMDAAALDASVQPLIGGWLSQARARLAVEEAIRETLLRAITGRRGGSPS